MSAMAAAPCPVGEGVRWPRGGGRETEAIAVRRVGVIVALGALLGMFGGVTASPALAARGPKWVRFGHEGAML